MNIVLLVILLGAFILLCLLSRENAKQSGKNQKTILYSTMTLVGFAIGVAGFIVFGG